MSWWKQRTRLSGLICILFTFSEFASFDVLTVCLFVPLWSNSIQLPLLQIRSRGWIIFWNLSLPENHETIKWAELDFERRPLRWRGETLRTNAWEESPIRFCPRSRPFWKRESVKDILQHGPRVEEKKKKREIKDLEKKHCWPPCRPPPKSNSTTLPSCPELSATCRLRGDGDRRELMKTLLSSLTRRLSSQLSGAQVDYFLPASSELK